MKFDEIPSGPHLIAPYKPQRSGVDYLNLRQVNLDLMASAIPGTNNVTRYVRPYSLMCWIYWMFPKIVGTDEATNEDIRLFREKVESLYLWSHLLQDLAGIPGTSSPIPEPQNGLVDLTFQAWGKRQAVNTSLQAAVQYGPSLSDLGGIGFLHHIDSQFYQVTDRGEQLAIALDQNLKESSCYSNLIKVDYLKATKEQAIELFNHWRVDQTTPREREVFQATLWDPDTVPEENAKGRRSATVRLILGILQSTEASLGEQDIRERMSFPNLWGKQLDQLEDGLGRHCQLWTILQFRQLQRLALETLMGWVEGFLIYEGNTLPDQLIEKAHGGLCELLEMRVDAKVKDLLEATSIPFNSMEEYLEESKKAAAWIDLFILSEELLIRCQNEDRDSSSVAFFALLLLYNCRKWFESLEEIRDQLYHGGASRVSLRYWYDAVEKMLDRPSKELVDWTIKNLIISQHFAVGTNRFDGERIRLRIILEEDGLEALVDRPWHPVVTPDRLAAFLSLMASCGLIKKDGDKYRKL